MQVNVLEAKRVDQPLMGLSKSKRDEAVKKICERVLSGAGQTHVCERGTRGSAGA